MSFLSANSWRADWACFLPSPCDTDRARWMPTSQNSAAAVIHVSTTCRWHFRDYRANSRRFALQLEGNFQKPHNSGLPPRQRSFSSHTSRKQLARTSPSGTTPFWLRRVMRMELNESTTRLLESTTSLLENTTRLLWSAATTGSRKITQKRWLK